jgi:hypothetical protein
MLDVAQRLVPRARPGPAPLETTTMDLNDRARFDALAEDLVGRAKRAIRTRWAG